MAVKAMLQSRAGFRASVSGPYSQPGSGTPGEDGATFIPAVSPEGVISWSNDRGLENPEPVDIKGPQGAAGPQGPKGDTGATGPQGEPGNDGVTYTPYVSEGGELIWTNNGGLPNPPSTYVKGEKGDKGDRGDRGQRGAGLLSVFTVPYAYTAEVDGIKVTSRMEISDIKEQAGVTEVLPGDTVQSGYYLYPIVCLDASYAYFATRVSIRGETGKDGSTPVKGVDYFTEADKAEMVADVKEALANDDAPEIIITENAGGVWWNNNSVPEFYVPTDGTAVCSKETNYIEVSKGDTFRVTTRTSNGWAANGAWYDADYNVISVIIVDGDQSGHETVELTAPDGAIYARFFSYVFNSDVSLCTLAVEYLGQEEDTTSASPLKGKKIVYDGDSICSSWGISTNGGSYPQIIADIVGGTFDNQGVGGGRIVTQEGSSDTFHSIVDNLVNLPTDGDLYCFEGGVNDHWHDVPLGTFSESDYTGALDKTTYCGALETIFRYATTKFVGKPICYIIVHKCPYSAFSKYGTEHTFADFREAALGICEKYSIPVYDAWKDSGINSWNSAQLANFFIVDDDTGTGDGTHPNEAGYRRYYVPQLIDLFERIMPIGVEDIESPEEPAEPTYTNVLDTVGWKNGVYLSNGNEGVDTNACTSGYIPITTVPFTIYLKNVTMPDESSHGNRVGYYKDDKSFLAQMSITSSYSDARPVFGEDGNLKQFYVSANEVAYIRINAWGIDETSIITINEPIE